jgi:ribosomal protein S20
MRFRNVVNRLSGLADCQILDLTLTESNGDAQAASLTFTVKFERDAFVPLTGSSQGTATVGNDIGGSAMDTVAKAVANAVAQGIRDATTGAMRVATAAGDDQVSITVAASSTAANTLGTVTVTLIDTVTLANA